MVEELSKIPDVNYYLDLLCKGKTNEFNALRVKSRYQRINLSNANLSGSDLCNTNLSNANLSGSDLLHANLSYADLSKSNLLGSWLIQVNLSHANLSYAKITGTWFTSSDLSHANLSNTNLVTTNLERTNLSYANLTGVKIFNPIPRWRTRTCINYAILRNADLTGVKGSNQLKKDLKKILPRQEFEKYFGKNKFLQIIDRLFLF